VILVDTSIWVDHFRSRETMLPGLLAGGQVLAHPFVIGELAMGNLRDRKGVLGELSVLPQVNIASDQEVLAMIEGNHLHGMGLGYIDAHLLAAVRLTPDTSLWTSDTRLGAVAERLSIIAKLAH
jgi:predicted nucleic acid-binding protein